MKAKENYVTFLTAFIQHQQKVEETSIFLFLCDSDSALRSNSSLASLQLTFFSELCTFLLIPLKSRRAIRTSIHLSIRLDEPLSLSESVALFSLYFHFPREEYVYLSYNSSLRISHSTPHSKVPQRAQSTTTRIFIHDFELTNYS